MDEERIVTRIASSSSDEIYEVVIAFDSKDILASCTCQAGKFRRWCKHKKEAVERLGDKARSTSMWELLREIDRIDGAIGELKKERKNLARQLVDSCAYPGEL